MPFTARLKIENEGEIQRQPIEQHVRDDFATHPSFATPVTDSSIG